MERPRSSVEGLNDHELVADLLARVKALEDAALERQHQALLSRTDRAALSQLLPVVAAVLGSEGFTSRDLAAHAAPALRLVLRGRSAKSIGKLLRRAVGVPVDGFLVEDLGIEINVALWRVVACPA